MECKQLKVDIEDTLEQIDASRAELEDTGRKLKGVEHNLREVSASREEIKAKLQALIESQKTLKQHTRVENDAQLL